MFKLGINFKVSGVTKFLVFVLMLSTLGSALVSIYLLGINGTRSTRQLLIFIVGSFVALQVLAVSLKQGANRIIFLFPLSLIVLSMYLTKDTSPLISLFVFLSLLGWGYLATMILRIDKIRAPILFPLFGQSILSGFMVMAATSQTMRAVGIFFITGGLFLFAHYLFSSPFNQYFLPNKNVRILPARDNLLRVFKVSMSIVFTMHALVALAPDLGFDSLQNKSWLPRQWNFSTDILLNTNHILNGVTSSQTFVVYLGNILGTVAIGAKLQFLYLLYTFAIVYNFVSIRLKGHWTAAVQLLLLTTFSIPVLLFQSSTGYDDSFLLLICTSAFIFWISMAKSVSRFDGVLIGVVAGCLVSAKFSLLPISFAIILTYILYRFRIQDKLCSKLSDISLLLITSALVSSPMYVYKYLNYQNPFWPLFNKIFQAPTLLPTNEHFNFPMGKSLDFKTNFLAPLISYFKPGYWGEEVMPTIYGLTLLFLYLALLMAFVVRKEFGIGPFILVFVFLVNWWLNFRYLRYLIPLLGVTLIIFFCYLFKTSNSDKKQQVHLKSAQTSTVVLLSIGLLSAVALPIGNSSSPERVPLKVIFGGVTKSEYLNQITPTWDIANYINANLPENSILVTSFMHQALWLRPDIQLYSYWEILRNSSIEPDYAILLTSTPFTSQIGDLANRVCKTSTLDSEGITIIEICGEDQEGPASS